MRVKEARSHIAKTKQICQTNDEQIAIEIHEGNKKKKDAFRRACGLPIESILNTECPFE